MNSFALLQDDVEDASDHSVDNSSNKNPKSTIPAVAVQDARSAREVVHKKDVVTTNGANEDSNQDNEENADENPSNEQEEISVPKEKEMTLEEYLEKKAALSSGLASLNSRIKRQANDGRSEEFEKMRMVRKSEQVTEGALMADLHVKEEVAGDKQFKDSTIAAVARNAEIQKFFQRDASDNHRRRNDYRRGSSDRRSNPRANHRNVNSTNRYNDRNNHGNNNSNNHNNGNNNNNNSNHTNDEKTGNRSGRFDSRNNGYRGGRNHRGRGRGGYRSYRSGYGQDDSKYMANGNSDSIVPNVDDTVAFPAL